MTDFCCDVCRYISAGGSRGRIRLREGAVKIWPAAIAGSRWPASRTSARRGIALRACVSVAVLFIWAVSTSPAQTLQDTLVTRSRGGADVLRVITDLEVPPSHTFGVARVTISNPKRPSPADRNLVVVLYVGSWGDAMEGFSYSVPVQLSEGQTQVTVEIPHLQSGQQNSWDIAIFEDGHDLEDHRSRPRNSSRFQWTTYTNQTAAYAALQGTQESAAQAGATLNQLFSLPTYAKINSTTQASSGAQFGNLASMLGRTVPIKEAADDWRYYYPYAVWAVSASTLHECNTSFPGVAKALKEYVAAGGCLLVHGAGDYSDDIERLISGRSASDDASSTSVDSQPSERAKGVRSKNYVLGRIVITTDEVADVDPNLLDTYVGNVVNHPSLRTDMGYDGNWFWTNLIETVGKPPVWSFAFIVALFGALIGPGLLFLTARLGRRSLMILMVPLIAILATSAIISYGILHEGFDTHVRITSLSRVDAASRFGFAWSRQNYFSGLPPRDGFVLRKQTYARPVYADESRRYRYGDPRDSVACQVTITDQQRWRGWLKPRQQQQLLIGHSLDQIQLPVELHKTDDGGLRVTNATQQDLPLFVARGQHDDYYFTEALAIGQSVELAAIDETQAGAKVAQSMVDYRPEPPPEMQDGGSLLDFGGRRRSASRTVFDGTDVIASAMSDYLSERLNMKPFSYATILSQQENIEVPLEGKRTNGLHIVIGDQTW